MDIVFKCPECNAKFRVGGHAAGKKTKCPKCGATVSIPVPAVKPAPPSVAAAESPSIGVVSPVANSPVDKNSPAPADAAAPLLFTVSPPSKPGNPGPGKQTKKGKSLPRPMLLAGAGIGVGVVVLGLLIAVLFSGRGNSSAANKKPEQDKAEKKASQLVMLTIDWPESERSEAMLSIDGQKTAFPQTGPIQIKVKPGKHVVGILRKDFQPVRAEVVLDRGRSESFRPEWKESSQVATANTQADPQADQPSSFQIGSGIVIPGFEGWQQSLAVAKEKAATEKKDILIVFGSSDGNPNTVRLAKALTSAGLPQGELGKKYVPLVIDFPETDSGGNRVLDWRQNHKLQLQYNVAQLPILALADDQGHPYAIQRTWSAGVANAGQVIETLSTQRAERDTLFAAASEGGATAQLDGVVALVNWLTSHKLLVQYRDVMRPWWDLALKEDPVNAAGKQEVLLEAEMMCQLTDIPEDSGRVSILQRFEPMEPWLGERRFVDNDRGFKLHFLTGNLMARLGDEEAALAHIQRAVTYDPKAPELQDARKFALGFSEGVISNGTGFIVAEGGYILTNKHVVDGPGRVAVRIAGVKEPIVAKSVQLHEELDVALVQVDLPESYTAAPLALNVGKINRGLEVAAFGYPRSSTLGDDVKLTQGAISSLPNASLGNMILLDLRINPGNSGGPLSDVHGNVVGMIAAKTKDAADDTYGMAIPATELDEFLKEVLPDDAKRGTAQPTSKSGSWDKVDAQLSPAVLMIVKLR